MTAADLQAQVPESDSYALAAWGWNQAGCGDGAGARSASSYRLIDSLAPPTASVGENGLPYVAGPGSFCYADVLFSVLQRKMNYVELHVVPNASGEYDFSRGNTVVLEWEARENMYNFRDVPCDVYLGAAMNPPGEDTEVSVNQIVGSGALYIFDSAKRATRYSASTLRPMYKNVRFPVPNIGSYGTITFNVPGGAAGRWVFAAAFVRRDNGQYPADPPVELSNGFTLH
jgi:hypothetical protein